MGRLIDADLLKESMKKFAQEQLLSEYQCLIMVTDVLDDIDNQPTAYDVDKDNLINAMAKTLLSTDFGGCALCDNHAKNITIDGVNNGCDGNCRHDKEYTEKDIIKWFKEQLRRQIVKGGGQG